MKYLFILFFVFNVSGQSTILPETVTIDSISLTKMEITNYPDGSKIKEKDQKILYFNPRKNVSIFFPSTIRQGITGSENVTFSYNTEASQYFGILKGIKTGDSNLLVITNDGQIYSFLLRYQYDIPVQNYFIELSESIGNENPTVNDLEEKENKKEETYISVKSPLQSTLQERNYDPNTSDFETVNYRKTPKDTSYLKYNKDRLDYMRAYSSNLVATLKSNGFSTKHSDIKLTLLSIVYNYNEMYFTFEIDNQSGVDYDINLLDVSIANNKQQKRKSAQTLLKKPIFTFELLNRIPRKSTKRIVYVFPKFSINDEKKLIIELNEFGGERNLQLDIKYNYVNNPD